MGDIWTEEKLLSFADLVILPVKVLNSRHLMLLLTSVFFVFFFKLSPNYYLHSYHFVWIQTPMHLVLCSDHLKSMHWDVI